MDELGPGGLKAQSLPCPGRAPIQDSRALPEGLKALEPRLQAFRPAFLVSVHGNAQPNLETQFGSSSKAGRRAARAQLRSHHWLGPCTLGKRTYNLEQIL